MSHRPTWHEYFLMLAKMVSVRSTCNSRKIGAVIVKNNRILATGYNGAVHGAPHCTDQGPDFCLRRSIGAHDSEKYNYCLSSHAEVNAVNQAARFGISLEGATLYCTLEPCNWCFKQLIQAGIREIYFEETYDSKNKRFDKFWRGIMESQETIAVFNQTSISPESRDMMIDVLKGSSARQMAATSPSGSSELDIASLEEVAAGLTGEGKRANKPEANAQSKE